MQRQKVYTYTLGDVVIFIPAFSIKEARAQLPLEISRMLSSSNSIPTLEELGYLEGEEGDSMLVFTEDLLKEAGIDFFFKDDDL